MIEINGNFSRGIAISRWLKAQGLEHNRDYTWHRKYGATKDRLIFEFNDPQWESMVALKWL